MPFWVLGSLVLLERSGRSSLSCRPCTFGSWTLRPPLFELQATIGLLIFAGLLSSFLSRSLPSLQSLYHTRVRRADGRVNRFVVVTCGKIYRRLPSAAVDMPRKVSEIMSSDWVIGMANNLRLAFRLFNLHTGRTWRGFIVSDLKTHGLTMEESTQPSIKMRS